MRRPRLNGGCVMTEYRTRPETVHAIQWRGDNEAEVQAWVKDQYEGLTTTVANDRLTIRLETHGYPIYDVGSGQWIVRDPTSNRFRAAVSDAVFTARYQPVPAAVCTIDDYQRLPARTILAVTRVGRDGMIGVGTILVTGVKGVRSPDFFGDLPTQFISLVRDGIECRVIELGPRD